MKSMRTQILGFLTAVLLALTFQSGTAFGAEKQYLISVDPTSGSSATNFVFTFTNDGNSSFNSLSLALPSGWSIAAGANPSSNRGVATVNTQRTVVTVDAINLPTGAGQSMTVTVSGVLSSGTTCIGTVGTWLAQPWTGSTVGSGQKFNLKPNSSPAITTVQRECFTVTYSSTGNGAIDGVTAGTSPATRMVAPNATTSFTLAPASGYYSGPVSGTCGGNLNLATNAYTTGQVISNCTVVAGFSPNPTITATAGTGGSILPSGAVSVSYNGSKTFGITVNSLFSLADVLVDGASVGKVTSYTFNNVISNRSIAASFVANGLAISLPQYGVTAGTEFPVTVTLSGDTNRDVALQLTCGSTTTTQSKTATGSSVEFVTTIANIGTCSVTASADNYAPASKTFTVYTGTVSCVNPTNYVNNNGNVDPNNAYVDLTLVAPTDWGVRRGPNLTPTQTCVDVDVSMVFPDPYTAHFTFDKTLGQTGNFKYMVIWGEVSVDATAPTTSWTNKRPKVAWVENLAGQPVWVPSLACVDDDLTQRTLLMPVLPSVAPFLGVTGTQSNADYYPGDPNAAAKAARYLANGSTKAQMCVAQHGWMSMGLDGGVIKVLYWSKIVDQVDAWAAIDQ